MGILFRLLDKPSTLTQLEWEVLVFGQQAYPGLMSIFIQHFFPHLARISEVYVYILSTRIFKILHTTHYLIL